VWYFLVFQFITMYYTYLFHRNILFSKTHHDKGSYIITLNSLYISSTNKTNRHEITEILLKVAVNTLTITPTLFIYLFKDMFNHLYATQLEPCLLLPLQLEPCLLLPCYYYAHNSQIRTLLYMVCMEDEKLAVVPLEVFV
jgi:hypothetical protein